MALLGHFKVLILPLVLLDISQYCAAGLAVGYAAPQKYVYVHLPQNTDRIQRPPVLAGEKTLCLLHSDLNNYYDVVHPHHTHPHIILRPEDSENQVLTSELSGVAENNDNELERHAPVISAETSGNLEPYSTNIKVEEENLPLNENVVVPIPVPVVESLVEQAVINPAGVVEQAIINPVEQSVITPTVVIEQPVIKPTCTCDKELQNDDATVLQQKSLPEPVVHGDHVETVPVQAEPVHSADDNLQSRYIIATTSRRKGTKWRIL